MIQENVHIDQLLGDPTQRYFSTGFRFFEFTLEDCSFTKDSMQGTARAIYNGPARPRDETPHLGSIEYLAVALRLATVGLNRLARLGKADVDRALLTRYTINIQDELGVGDHPFQCRMVSSESSWESVQGSITVFSISIGPTQIELRVDHRGGVRYMKQLPDEETIQLHLAQLFSIGYRHRSLDIHSIALLPEHHTATARVRYTPHFEENILHGIGSARDTLLPTEATQVFGQLMQALLYDLYGTDRSQCATIWLRKMELHIKSPLFRKEQDAAIMFDHIRDIQRQGVRWRLIDLHGSVGAYTGKFSIAHQTEGGS